MLKLAFLWHQHQPYYKDLRTGQYLLPWVRLHGIKDYLDMVEILKPYPRIKQTFNMVPSLLEQIVEYADGSASDPYLEMTLRRAEDLTEKDKSWIIGKFFQASPEHMIAPYERYRHLFNGRQNTEEWTDTEWRDLQALFNLAWIDPSFKKTGRLREISEKGRGYSEEEKREILSFQRKIISDIIPRLREYREAGQIEISTTPYFHPIMPLLYDTDIARVAMPEVSLPSKRFSHPEDVTDQVAMAVEFHASLFGEKPKGMWPSEGSVSEDIIPILSEHGIKWIATDEDILAGSLSLPARGEDKHSLVSDGKLYKSYRFGAKAGEIRLFFRDRQLSDNVGFVYSRWDPEKAADDFMGRLKAINEKLGNTGDGVVSVILDGENAWEYYKNDGHDFLNALYSKISSAEWLETTTFSGYLENNQQARRLPKIFPGSWINHNFGVWIGHEEDNKAWDLLSMAREELVAFEAANPDFDPQKRKLAWREIFIAEGSDWCWWFGDDHVGPNNDDFDRLFRAHLANIYYLTDREPPPEFFTPVRADYTPRFRSVPIDYFTPKIDGKISHYYEWSQAGFYDCTKAGSTMHRGENVLSGIWFGFDPKNMYIRLDPAINDYGLDPYKFIIEFPGIARSLNISKSGEGVERDYMFCFGEILEIKIPFAILGDESVAKILFKVIAKKEDKLLESWPLIDSLEIDMPKAGSDSIPWVV
ncbi:MAG: glycoside hydrolase family 57 protein [candidate division Zixibacteria bacterium]